MGDACYPMTANAQVFEHLQSQSFSSVSGEAQMCLIDQHLASHPGGPIPKPPAMSAGDAEGVKNAFKKGRSAASAAKAVQYAFEYGLAIQTVREHAAATQVLKTMRKAIRKYENVVKNTQGPRGVKAAQEMAKVKSAYQTALAAYNEEKAAVRAANQFLREFEKVRAALAKVPITGAGRKVIDIGKSLAPHAQRLTVALKATTAGRASLSAGRVVARPAFKKGLTVLAAASEGIISYLDSPAETEAGKVANGLTGAAAGVLPMLNVPVAIADAVAPSGYKPTEHFRGTAASVTVIAESMITGDIEGLDNFHKKSLKGEYGVVMQASSEAGDYWAKHGIVGGLELFWDALTD